MEDEGLNLEEMREVVEAFQSLLTHPGWGRLVRLAEEQVYNRTQKVMKTPTSREYTSMLQEFEKGEASGIELFMAIPLVTLEQFKDLITEEIDDGSS